MYCTLFEFQVLVTHTRFVGCPIILFFVFKILLKYLSIRYHRSIARWWGGTFYLPRNLIPIPYDIYRMDTAIYWYKEARDHSGCYARVLSGNLSDTSVPCCCLVSLWSLHYLSTSPSTGLGRWLDQGCCYQTILAADTGFPMACQSVASHSLTHLHNFLLPSKER